MLLVGFSVAFVVLLAIGVPISMGLGGAAMAYVFLHGDLSPTMLVQNAFGGMTAYPLLAIPLFILAGNLMNAGGLSKDLVNFARLLVGHVSGGLGPRDHSGQCHLRRHLGRGGRDRGGDRHGDDPGHEGRRL